MAEYTKGEWGVSPYGDGNFYVESSDRQIATVHCYSVDKSDKIARANAHLIAAAPAMYEALKDAERTLEAHLKPFDPRLLKIRQIIALAEGTRIK